MWPQLLAFAKPVLRQLAAPKQPVSVLIPTEALWNPVMDHGRRGGGRWMEDEHDGPALLSAGGGEVHRQPCRHDHRRSSRPADLHTSVGSFQTGFPAHRVPRLGARVDVCGGRHPGREDGFHQLRRVWLSSHDRKGSNLGDVITICGPPLLLCDRHQPNLAQRLHDYAVRSLVTLRSRPCGVRIQVPEYLRLCELAHRVVCQNPATDFPGSAH